MGLTRYDIIGRDVERILHRSPARVWVECVERPVLRKKGESNAPSPVILQASAPIPVLGGGHVGADFQAGALVDKFVYHIPEYRQVKMYADAEVGLSTSTPNDWVHRAADKLYPLCETLIDAQRSHPHLAAKALEYIATLYMLEENFRSCEASGEEIREQRRTRAFPVMDAMKAWMESVQHRCTPDDPPGKALEYAYKLWPRMRKYADDGQCQLDNNPVERGTKAHRHGTRKLPLQQINEGAVTMGHIFTAGKLRNRRSKPAQMDGTCARQAQTRQHRGRTCKVTPLQLLLKHVEFRMVTMRSPPAICLLLTKCRLPSVVSSFGGLTKT